MLIPLNEIRLIFQKITKKSLVGGCTVVILCSFEVDSLCAGLLKEDGISYKVIPISGYTDLDSQIEKLKEHDSLQSLVFINNGGSIDLTSKWFAEEHLKIKTFVFDYHRPVHHCNVNSVKKVIMIDDGYFNLEEVPADEDFNLEASDDEFGDFRREEDRESKQEERNQDEEEAQFEEEEKEPEIYKEIEMNKPEESNRLDGEEDEEEYIDVGLKRKQAKLLMKKEQKKIKIEKIQRTQNYYRGTYYGKSIAGVMYTLAQQLNKENMDYLWFWIIGITDQLIHNRISYEQYTRFISDCYTEVMRLNAKFGNEDIEENVEEPFDSMSMLQQERIKVESVNRKVGTIIIEREYDSKIVLMFSLRFFLLRNWTLYDSMFYSNYLASKLGIWREKGKQELHKLIARIGIPLEEARQQYRYMNNNLKKHLKEKVLDVTDNQEYEFSDILIDSFIRQIDTKTQLSASDLVYAISAILESPKDLETESGNIDNVMKTPIIPEEERNQDKNIFLLEYYEYNRIRNFWYAYEALANKKKAYLDAGLALAIEMQKNTMNEAIYLIEKKAISSCSQFRYCIINNSSNQEKYFHHPLTIQKLGILIMSFFKEQKKANNQTKPFLACVHNQKINTYLIVGLTPTGTQLMNDDGDRNEFGRKFDDAASKSNVRVKFDNFDSSIVEIHKEDFDAFLDELTEVK